MWGRAFCVAYEWLAATGGADIALVPAGGTDVAFAPRLLSSVVLVGYQQGRARNWPSAHWPSRESFH